MATPRAVRIPRSPPGSAGPPVPEPPLVPAVGPAAASRSVERRENRAGRQRALRLTTIYLGALLLMYLGFVALDRFSPGGTSPTATDGLFLFTGLAALFAVGGSMVTLGPAPRAVEVGPTAVVVVEWSGRRRTFPPLADLRVDVVRRYPAGLLSRDPVEAVELTGDRRRRTYQVTEGLLPERRPGRTESIG